MLLTIVAALPFFLLFLLMVAFKRPAIVTLPAVLLSTIATTYFIWGMEPLWYGVTFIKALFITLDILLIILGAIVLFLVLKNVGIFHRIQSSIEGVSLDRRVQAILIAWFFVSLIEGAAGFGTPAMLAAPILVQIGFRPLLAVVITLIGDSVAVTFGAVGVPITVGIAQGLILDQAVINGLIPNIIQISSLFHILLGSLIPLVISCTVTYFGSRSILEGLKIWKFALLSGVSFTLPMHIVAITFGPELPSVLASLLGIFIVLFLAKHKIFLPKNAYRFIHDNEQKPNYEKVKFITLFRSFLPYFLLVFLLAATRPTSLPFWKFTNSLAIDINSILGSSISHAFTPFHSPGFMLLVVAAFSILYYKMPIKSLLAIFNESVEKIRIPFITLFAALSLVNVLLYSEFNSNGLPRILLYLSSELSYLGSLWPVLSPFIGLIGAFATGSATVSNLLFSMFQYETALLNNYPPELILSLQVIGGSMGNMIAIHNIVVVLSVVGLHHKEGQVLRYTIIPAICYVVLAGIIALIATYIIK